MKRIYILYFLCFVLPSHLTAQIISGQVVNESDNQPIFGVTIFSNGIPFTFTNQEGKFEIDDRTTIKTLTFSHLAFVEKSLDITSFDTKFQIVKLNEKTLQLDEVELVAKNDLNLKAIVKKSSKIFIEYFKMSPYYAMAYAKQVIIEDHAFKGYIEIDGFLHHFVPSNNNAFQTSYFIPKQFRKNVENLNSLKLKEKNKQIYNYHGLDHFRDSFLQLQSINLAHPLNKMQKYAFERFEDVEINGLTYYNIQFFQKKSVHVKRSLFNIYGEMLISKEDFSIYKLKASFDFDHVKSNEIEITYENVDQLMMSSKVITTVKLIGEQLTNKNIYFETELLIDNEKVINVENTDFGHHICYQIDEINYDSNYWQQKIKKHSTPLIEKFFINISEQDFANGAKQKQIETKSKYYSKLDEEMRILQVKKLKETLKNINL